MKSLFTAFFLLVALQFSTAQMARVQFIHNAPGDNVDIYIDDNLYVDNFVFRTATPYVDVPIGTLNIQIAPANSTSSEEAMNSQTLKINPDETYVVMLGLVQKGSPDYQITMTNQVSELADTGNTVGIAFANGTPDAGDLDFFWKEFAFSLYDDVAYGNFGEMISLPTGAYDIDITAGFDNEEVFISNSFDFSWWRGNSLILFTSGFAEGEPAMKTYVALSTGGTFPLESLPMDNETSIAFTQFIHNAVKENVDIYIDEVKLEDDLVFRTATPFLELKAKQEITIGIAPKNSESVQEVYKKLPITLQAEGEYVMMLNGAVTGNPNDISIDVYDQGKQSADSNSKVSLLFCNGAMDAPTLDFSVDDAVLHRAVAQGDFASYTDFEPSTYQFELSDNSGTRKSYEARFGFWKGGSAVVYTSGNFDGSTPNLKLFVALSTGGTFPLREMDSSEIEGRNSTILDQEGVLIETLGNITYGPLTTNLYLPEVAPVSLVIVDTQGRPVMTERYGKLDAGMNRVVTDAYKLTSGNYFIRWKVGRVVQTQRIVVAGH